AQFALPAMAAATSRIRLGSAIMYALARTPLLTVAEARDLDELTKGRFILGVGTGTRQQVAAWHGLEADHLAPRLEELVPLLRRLWRFREGQFRPPGRSYRPELRAPPRVPGPGPADLGDRAARLSPPALRGAGRVGDGLVGHPLFRPEYVAEVVRPALVRGAELAGRRLAVPVAGYLICAVADRAEQARHDAASQVAFSAVVRAFDPIQRFHGFDREVAEIREAFRAGDKGRMTALVTE